MTVEFKRWTARVAVAALGVASAAILADGGTASAATQIGELTVSPDTSATTDVYAEFDTNGACPAGATNMIVKLFGSGLDAEGANLTGTTSLSIIPGNAQGGKHPAAGVPIKQLFSEAGVVTPNGQYTIRAMCLNASGSTEYGDFVGLINFTSTGTPFEASYTTSLPAAVTSTTLAAVSSPVTYGASVTFNATVSPAGAAGTVQFKDGATNLGSPQAVSGGAASYTTSALGAGSHNITAEFIPTSASAFSGSTSTARTLVVDKASTSVSVATNGPTEEFAPAVFTATTTAGVPGTVQFKVDGANVGSPAAVSGGTATYSTTSLTPGTYQVSAVFTPTSLANYNASTSGDAAHNVTAYAGVTATETITATVAAGALVISVDGDAAVAMSTPTINTTGDFLVSTGAIDPLIVTDTRAGDPGWNVNGVVTDFVNGPNSVSKYNLGWEPNAIELAANQTAAFVVGADVAAGTQASASAPAPAGTIGLGAARSLGSAPDNSGNGTAKLGADLTLRIPTDVPAGAYTATLTFTAI